MSVTMGLILFSYVVLCAVIAYIGDLLGRRMGKKRITLFGLRPRHTAILITSFIGGLIALSTIVVMLSLGTEARKLVLRGDELIHEQRSLELKLGSTRKDLSQKTEQLVASIALVQQNKKDLDRVTLELKTAQVELKVTDEKLSTLQNELKTATIGLREKQLEVRDLQQRRETLIAEVASKNKFIKEKETTIAKQTGILKNQMNDIIAQMNKFNDLQNQNADLEKSNKEMSDQNIALERNNDALSHRNNELSAQNVEFLHQAEEISKLIQDLTKTSTGRITFNKDEEITRRAVSGGISIADARLEIQQLLTQANRVANERGVTAGANGMYVYIPRMILPDKTIFDEDRCLEALANEISSSKGEVVVIVSSLFNTTANEPARIMVKPFWNRLIYSQGQTVAQMEFKTKSKDEDLLSSLIAFLRNEVRNNALDAGLIPVREKDGELAPVGQVNGTELLQVIEQLRKYRGNAVVTVIAANNTYSSGPLKLTFKVKTGIR